MSSLKERLDEKIAEVKAALDPAQRVLVDELLGLILAATLQLARHDEEGAQE